jgi:cytochrome c-type biogenesis protein CcmH/NrfG
MQISGRWTASLARRLGLDGNPLRRGTDRAESWIRIVLVLAFLIGAPLTGWGAGRWAESVAPTAAHAQLAGEHRVPATLLAGVPISSAYYSGVGLGWVKARWTVPGGSVRTGYVQAWVGSRAGSTVPVWLDRSGELTAPPLPRSQIQGWVLMMTVLATAVLALMLLAAMGLLGRVLERQRLANWEQAWSAVEPQWTRRPR